MNLIRSLEYCGVLSFRQNALLAFGGAALGAATAFLATKQTNGVFPRPSERSDNGPNSLEAEGQETPEAMRYGFPSKNNVMIRENYVISYDQRLVASCACSYWRPMNA